MRHSSFDRNEKARIVSFFVHHPNAANLLMVFLLIAGLFAGLKLNTQFFPNFVIDRIVVNINWPGASAEDVEANILAAVEPQIRFLEDVKKIDSTAREGGASITLEYEQGADLKEAEADIDAAIDKITTLPEDSEDPEIKALRFFDRVATLTIHGPFPEKTMRVFAKRMRDDFLTRGIDQVVFTGLRDEEVHIDIHEGVQQKLDLTIGDISSVLRNNTQDLPSGDLKGAIDRQIRTLGETAQIKSLRDVEILAFESGERLLLGDVATLQRAYDEDQPRTLVNGNPAITMRLDRAENSDALKLSQIVDDYLVEAKQIFPKSLVIEADASRTDALRARIQLLLKNGIGGLLLVILVLFIFLNARVAFWVTAGIPVAIAATLAVMFLAGQTINMVSLFALLMMLGIIVDDAIVVGEHTATRYQMGDPSFLAAERGAGRMVLPVVAASLTTAAAFGPILLIGDVVGQIMGVIPIVVICTLIASVIECFFILPGHLAHALNDKPKRLWSPWRQFIVSLLLAAFCVAALQLEAGSTATLIQTAFDGNITFANGFDIYKDWMTAESWVSFISNDGLLSFLIRALFYGLQFILSPLFATIHLFTSWLISLSLIFFNWFLYGLGAFIFGFIYLVKTLVNLFPAGATPFLIGFFAFCIGSIFEIFCYLFARCSLRKSGNGQNRFRQVFDRGFEVFRDYLFARLLNLSFRWRYVTLALCVASMLVCAIGLMRGGKIGFSFFPSPEAETITAHVVLHAGLPRKQALEILSKIEKSAYALEGTLGEGENFIDNILITYGQSGVNRGQNFAEVKVDLTVSEIRSVRTPDIVRTWRKAVPSITGIKSFAISQRRGGSPGRDIDIQLQGGTPGTLKKAAVEIMAMISAIPGVSGVADSLPYGKPEIILDLNDRGRTLGLSIDDVGRQVRNAFEGSIARRLPEGDDEITLRVKQLFFESGADGLRNFQLRAPSGIFIPLGEVVDITQRQGFSALQRRNGKLTVSVTADIDDNITTTQEVIDELEENDSISEIVSTYGISYLYDGKDKERADAFADLRIGVGLALILIYIILAWMFGSYIAPLAVMTIIPFGVVGAIVGHYLLGFKLTILSFVGMLGLSGILVNDSLILMSRFRERRAGGDTFFDAATGASRDRLRAVLLTSLSTIGGLTPLMFETSRQAQFLLPMVITIVFGLAYATFLILFLVPALVGVGADIRRVFVNIFYGDTGGFKPARKQVKEEPEL